MNLLNGISKTDWRFFNDLSCSLLFLFYCFHFLFFISIVWYCGAGVFGLIGCKLLSPSVALPTFINTNDNNNYFLTGEGG